LNQFQHFDEFAEADCSGYATKHASWSASSFIRVPAARSSADCMHA
jgi:hypothetical protein